QSDNEFDITSELFDELPKLQLFEFNEENYIKAQMALEQEFVDQLSDENEEDFDADKVDSKNQEVSLLSIPVEEANEPVYRLNPTVNANFSPCVLIDYLDNKLQTCDQTVNVRNICQTIDTRKTVMWNLVHELLSAFCHSDDYNRYQNPLWNTTSPDQFTATSVTHLVQKSNKVGRRKLGVVR
ncbi:6511_t:CDS:2, partial [Funneliformis caledonium]